jgi:hypothetical protein
MGWNGFHRRAPVDLPATVERGHASCLPAIINKELRRGRKERKNRQQETRKKKKIGSALKGAKSLQEDGGCKGRMPNDAVRIINSHSTSSTDLQSYIIAPGGSQQQREALPSS